MLLGELYLSLTEVLLAAKDVVDNASNDGPHIKKLKNAVEIFRVRHSKTGKVISAFLADSSVYREQCLNDILGLHEDID